MKKNGLRLSLILLITFALTSCVTTNRGYQSSPVISRNVQLDPIKADITVNQTAKLVGESTSTYFGFLRISGDNTFADGITYSTDANASALSQFNPVNLITQGRLTQVRGAAAYKALLQGDYDVLVHPIYTITTEDFLIIKKYTVKVEGYGGKYTNFRTEKQKGGITGNTKEYVFPDEK